MTSLNNLKWFIIGGIIVGGLAGCHANSWLANEVCFKGRCVSVEIVQRQEDLQKGLQFRREMPDNHGMLFVFSENAQHTFWMKDTLIPLDMVWLDYAKRVVYIERNALPCVADPCPVYHPPQNAPGAMYVLEVNANKTARLGIQIGDELEFRFKNF